MRTVIEVGANKGQDTGTFLDGNTTVYAFEPVPELVHHLSMLFKGDKNLHLIPMAVDSSNGFKWFNIANDIGCSSLYQFSDDIYDKWQGRNGHFEFRPEGGFQAMTTRLDTFMNNYNINEVDYLWIDAQGNDFNVLKSLGNNISLIKEGRCEGAYTVELYKGTNNNVNDIKSWLEEKGFVAEIVPDAVGKEADVLFKRK
jgi:FkbM family methyltransferase